MLLYTNTLSWYSIFVSYYFADTGYASVGSAFLVVPTLVASLALACSLVFFISSSRFFSSASKLQAQLLQVCRGALLEKLHHRLLWRPQGSASATLQRVGGSIGGHLALAAPVAALSKLEGCLSVLWPSREAQHSVRGPLPLTLSVRVTGRDMA